MATSKKLPVHKRFPNQWSTKSVVYTPQATRMTMEGPISDEIGTLVLALLTSLKKVKEPSVIADMRALAEKLRPQREAENG